MDSDLPTDYCLILLKLPILLEFIIDKMHTIKRILWEREHVQHSAWVIHSKEMHEADIFIRFLYYCIPSA